MYKQKSAKQTQTNDHNQNTIENNIKNKTGNTTTYPGHGMQNQHNKHSKIKQQQQQKTHSFSLKDNHTHNT